MTAKPSAIDARLGREEETLKAAVVKAMDALEVAATHANIRNHKAAKQALQDYQDKKAGIEKFKTQAGALEYLQRNWKIEKSKLSKDVSNGKCPRKDGVFLSKDLDFYASAVNLPASTSVQPAANDSGDRLKNAAADEKEFRLGILKGDYIDAAEEEARDARLWAAIKSDLEHHAPIIVNELINRVMAIVEDEQARERIHKIAFELRLTYEDAVADIFDRYAQAGGIDA